MSHQVQNFSLHAGDDVDPITVAVKDTADNVINLTGAAIVWGVATRPVNDFDGMPRKITKTVGAGITITDAAGGIFKIDIDSADTLALFGSYWHQARINLAGAKSTVLTGTLTVERTIFVEGE